MIAVPRTTDRLADAELHAVDDQLAACRHLRRLNESRREHWLSRRREADQLIEGAVGLADTLTLQGTLDTARLALARCQAEEAQLARDHALLTMRLRGIRRRLASCGDN